MRSELIVHGGLIALLIVLLVVTLRALLRKERYCVDCRHYGAQGGLCRKPNWGRRNLVTGEWVIEPELASKARAATNTPEWCGHAGHHFQPIAQPEILQRGPE